MGERAARSIQRLPSPVKRLPAVASHCPTRYTPPTAGPKTGGPLNPIQAAMPVSELQVRPQPAGCIGGVAYRRRDLNTG